jgi:hypothetical protein
VENHDIKTLLVKKKIKNKILKKNCSQNKIIHNSVTLMDYNEKNSFLQNLRFYLERKECNDKEKKLKEQLKIFFELKNQKKHKLNHKLKNQKI